MEQVLVSDVTEADLAAATGARAQREWFEWSTMLAFYEQREAAIQLRDNPRLFERQAELSMIAMQIGRSTGMSEGQVSVLVSAARRVRDKTPSVWAAFEAGRIDAARVRHISSAVDKLQRAESIARLDRQVVAYAETHTVAELRRWLKIFVARVEADLFNERAERERADRCVEVIHGDDGMSWMNIYHQSHVLAAVDKRLTKEAKAFGADDPRTMQQSPGRTPLRACSTCVPPVRNAARLGGLRPPLGRDHTSGAARQPDSDAHGRIAESAPKERGRVAPDDPGSGH